MTEFVDAHYVNLLSNRLDKFVRKKTDVYNFRCPYCGDSQKHRNKARGYFFRVKTDLVYNSALNNLGNLLYNLHIFVFLSSTYCDLFLTTNAR